MSIIRRNSVEDRDFQQNLLLEVMRRDDSLAIVLPTAAGKTIMAILLADQYFEQGKVLFLVPNTELGRQHYASVMKYTTLTPKQVFWLSGEISREKRALLWATGRFFVATPQVVCNDLAAGNLHLWDFSLILFDEMHLAGESYDYVRIAELSERLHIRRFGFTATLRPDILDVELKSINHALVNLNLADWLTVSEFDESLRRYTFPKYERIYRAQVTENLQRFELALHARLDDLVAFLVERELFAKKPDKILSIRELDTLMTQLRDTTAEDWLSRNGALISTVAEYYKLRHLLSLLMTENYYAAWQFLLKLKAEALRRVRPIRASDRIIRSLPLRPIWLEIKALVEGGAVHPKEALLLQIMDEAARRAQQTIIFCNDKTAERGLQQLLARAGIATEIICAETTQSGKRHNAETLQRFSSGAVTVLISTSILEAGIHLPEVDVIVNYSVPLDENTMLQRRGRVGRSKIGYIYYLLIDYDFDTALLYSNLARARQMMRLIEAKNRGERLPVQGELFPQEEVE